MIEWLQYWLMTDDRKIIYLLTILLITNILDFSLGWINAKFNRRVTFSSGQAILGIARKIVLFILAMIFIPVSLLVPEPVGISALYVFYIGYIASEFNSILSHLNLASDDKRGNLIGDFLEKIFYNDGKGKK